MRTAEKARSTGDRVGLWPLVAFALPSFQTPLVQGPAGSIVPTLYGTEFGLNLALVGTALFISRAIDAVIDPLIGYLSDNTRSRIGRRKPWLIASALISMISVYFLYIPPNHPQFAYFLFWIVAAFIGWSVGEIPLQAWGAEISRSYTERTRVFTFRIVAAQLGGFAFFLLPLLPIFPTTAITPQTIRFVAYLALAAVPLTVGAAVFWGPKSVRSEQTPRQQIRDLLPLIRNNRPLQWYAGMFISAGFASGMFGAGTFLFLNNYLGLAKQVTFLFLAMLIVGIAFMPAAYYIIRRFGKNRSLACSLAIGLCLMTLMAFLPHGKAALIPLVVLFVPIACTNAIGDLAPVSMLGDIIDYDALKTGKKRAATFTALFVFVAKINSALGAAAAFALIGLTGFNAKLGAGNSETAVLGLKAAYIVIPCLIYAVAIYFAWTFPIDQRRHAVIVRRVEQREERARAAMEGASGHEKDAGALVREATIAVNADGGIA